MSTSQSAVQIFHALSTGLLATALVGCGRSGPASYEVSGMVTYAGQPVPAGKIVFEPDRQAGNSGHASTAFFSEGRYQTVAGRGPGSGPHLARIYGYKSGRDESGMILFGDPLFPRYVAKVDLPPQDSTQDFEVPANHGVNK